MKTTLHQGKIIDAEQGVDLKERSGLSPDFQCVECGGAARVHRSGGRNPAHFEHLERNEHCSLVHRPPGSPRAAAKQR